jgi:putative PIG3 family NAD(P)H quinone oxidoreductase
MRAVIYEGAGGTEVIRLVKRPTPVPGAGEVLVRVLAVGLNRPDIQQRRGLYPPPPGASDIAGLELAGIVEATADDVAWPRVGEPVCALLTAGAHAERAVVSARQCLPIPEKLSFIEAAVLPEIMFTVWNSMILAGRLGQGETLLIQGGTSGVGLAAMQVARLLRSATVIATAGTAEKLAACRDYGATHAISYRGDWPTDVRRLTAGRGVDLVLDGQGGSYCNRHVELLAEDGRLILLATHENVLSEVNCRLIVRRRLTLAGTTIRPRASSFKGGLADALRTEVWPLLASGAIRIPVCASFRLEEMAAAHAVLDSNAQIGKVAVTVAEGADAVPD